MEKFASNLKERFLVILSSSAAPPSRSIALYDFAESQWRASLVRAFLVARSTVIIPREDSTATRPTCVSVVRRHVGSER